MSLPTVSFSHWVTIEKRVLDCVRDFVQCNLQCQKGLIEDKSLDERTDECDHGKSSMNDFLFLTPQLILGRHISQDI